MWGRPDHRCEHCWHRVGMGLLHRQRGEEVLQSHSDRFDWSQSNMFAEYKLDTETICCNMWDAVDRYAAIPVVSHLTFLGDLQYVQSMIAHPMSIRYLFTTA